MGKKIELTKEQIDWLIENYKHTQNQDICDKLSITRPVLCRIRRTYNLKKCEELLKELNKKNREKADKKNKELGYPNQINLKIHQKKALENAKKTLKEKWQDEEWVKQRNKNVSEGLKKTYKAERRRVLFGFEQKTNLRVINTPRNKVMLKHNLRKHGYEIEKNSNIAYINDNTKQSALMEKRGVIMGIKFIKKQM